MLSEKEIKALIIIRLGVALDSCNSHHLNHVDGQIRALTAVLVGKPCPPRATTKELCDFVGIPCRLVSQDLVEYDDDWLQEHGFELEGDDFHYHDRNFGNASQRW